MVKINSTVLIYHVMIMITVTVMLHLHVAMINLTVMVMVVSVFHFHGTVMVQMSSVTLAGLLTVLMEQMRV